MTSVPDADNQQNKFKTLAQIAWVGGQDNSIGNRHTPLFHCRQQKNTSYFTWPRYVSPYTLFYNLLHFLELRTSTILWNLRQAKLDSCHMCLVDASDRVSLSQPDIASPSEKNIHKLSLQVHAYHQGESELISIWFLPHLTSSIGIRGSEDNQIFFDPLMHGRKQASTW